MHWIHEARLQWLFDLVDPEPSRRQVAQMRYRRHMADWSEALGRSNALWWANNQSWDFSATPAVEAAYKQHLAEQKTALSYTFSHVVGEFVGASWRAERRETFELVAPYAVLFLQWEAAYPRELRATTYWSPWGAKQAILRGFVRAGVPQAQRADLVALLTQTVSRHQQCEDRWYAALARRLDGPDVRAALDERRTSADEVVRHRAGYVLSVLDNPTMPVTLASWRRWLAQAADPADTPGTVIPIGPRRDAPPRI